MVDLRARSTLDNSQFNSGMGGMNSKVNSFKTTLAPIGGIIAGAFSIGAITSFTRSTIQLGSDMSDLATQSGLTIAQFQALEIAAVNAGTSSDKIRTALAKISVVMGQAKSGMKTYVDLFEKIGISQAEIARLNVQTVFEAIAKTMSTAERGSKEFGAALEIIGTRSGIQLLEVMQAVNEEGLGPMVEKMQEFGTVANDHVIKSLDDMNDRLVQLKRNAQLAWGTFIVETIDGFERIDQSIVKLIGEGKTLEDTYAEMFGKAFAKSLAGGGKGGGEEPGASPMEAVTTALTEEERLSIQFSKLADEMIFKRSGLNKQIEITERRLLQINDILKEGNISNAEANRLGLDMLKQQDRLVTLKDKARAESEKEESTLQGQVDKIADLRRGITVPIQAADRLARIGGQLGGRISPEMRLVQRQLETQEKIENHIRRLPDDLAEKLRSLGALD